MNATQTFQTLINLPVSESILLVGNHGIGKSEIVKQVGAFLNVPVIDFRLSQNDVGDLKGMPFFVHGRTVFAPPEFMPLTEQDANQIKELLSLTSDVAKGRYGDKGILFLDEVNRANREVQQAAFELVLDRRLNLRSLPDGWRVVAAVNGEDEVYNVNSLDPAFLSRFFYIKFDPTVEEWFDWAAKNNVHPAIREFLKRFPEFLDPTTDMLRDAATKGITKVHDRRAWAKFSKTINKFSADFDAKAEGSLDLFEKKPKNLDYLFSVASGFVGTMAAIKFKDFIVTDYKSLDASTILNKWNKDVSDRINEIVKAGRIPELATYNEALIDYIKNNIKDALDAKQSKNLFAYVNLLPNETVADFWQKFDLECKSVSSAWYASDKMIAKKVVSAMVVPTSAAKQPSK